MKRFNWEFDFDPFFPAHFFEYTVTGHRDTMHWHRYFEIGLCLEGNGTFQYPLKQYEVHPGDIIINNNYENHVAVTQDGNTNTYIFLILMPSFISDSRNHRANHQYIDTFRYNPSDFVNRIPGGSPAAQELEKLLRIGLSVYNEKKEYWEMEVDIIVRQVLSILAHYYSSSDARSSQQTVSPKVLAAQRYITQHYNRKISLSEIAAHVGLSTAYFRHLFAKETHISFKEYITYVRLSNARQLLTSTDLSINQIIEEIGYTNISQFYRIFREYYQMTPAEYRRMQLGAKQYEEE